MKFGGTSVRDAAAIERVRALVEAARREGEVCVVVSAFAGVTDQLMKAARQALTSYETTRTIIAPLHQRHIEVIEELVGASKRSALVADVLMTFNDLEDILHGVSLVRECSPSSLDLVASHGERLAARIIAYAFAAAGLPSRYVDARPLVLTDGRPGAAIVEKEETYARLREALVPGMETPVITGYIASNRDGVTTTLGRNGSDYTATLVGAALGAESIEIWTDVDGVFTADPNRIAGARVIERITFEEAQEMAYFGAGIVHPLTLQPAAEKAIPVVVRNTFNPSHPGTVITSSAGGSPAPVRSITTIEDVTLIDVEGSGMMGVPGIAGRLFTALAQRHVNVIMISQASSEHSICFVVRSDEATAALSAARQAFDLELRAGLVQRIEAMEDLAILSIIGSRMRGTIGLSGRFFSALGAEGVNVVAISQGSSELNISIVIAAADELRATEAVHRAFGLGEA